MKKILNKGIALIDYIVLVTIIGIIFTGSISIYSSQIKKSQASTNMKQSFDFIEGIKNSFQHTVKKEITNCIGINNQINMIKKNNNSEIFSNLKQDNKFFGKFGNLLFIYLNNLSIGGLNYDNQSLVYIENNEGNECLLTFSNVELTEEEAKRINDLSLTNNRPDKQYGINTIFDSFLAEISDFMYEKIVTGISYNKAKQQIIIYLGKTSDVTNKISDIPLDIFDFTTMMKKNQLLFIENKEETNDKCAKFLTDTISNFNGQEYGGLIISNKTTTKEVDGKCTLINK